MTMDTAADEREAWPVHQQWTFLTHHGHVLLAVARDPDIRVHDLAGVVGISDRATLMILQDLQEAGYLRRERVGRRNHYTLERGRPFRHPTTAAHDVDELIAIFTGRTGAPELVAVPREPAADAVHPDSTAHDHRSAAERIT